MDPIALILTIVGIIIAIIFGYLQVIVPFTKKEVKFSKKFPFVVSTTEVTLTTTIDTKAYAKVIEEKFPIPAERKPIAVMPFRNLTGEASFDYLSEAIPNLLITNLEQSKHLSVMTWERMHDLVEIMGKEDVPVIDEKLGFELCKLDGIDNIVLGSFTRAGNMFATDLKVLEVPSKQLLKSTNSKGEGIDSILRTQIDELSMHIAHGVGLSPHKIDKSPLRIADVTTNSIDAYNFFLRGREDCEKQYFDDARRFLNKAIELDSTFAEAYRYLGWVYNVLGNTKARNEVYEKAKTFSEKAPDKERLYIEAVYARDIEKNHEKHLSILKQMAQKYPKEKIVHYSLGYYYFTKKLFNEAIEYFNKALKLDPNYGFAINELAYTYAAMENFEKAVAYLKRYASISPGDANPFDSMAEIYLKMGNLDEAIVKYKEALDVKADFGSEWRIAYIYMLKEDYTESLKWIDQFISRAQFPGRTTEGYIWKGFYQYWLGRLDESLSDLRRAENMATEVENKLWMAYADWVKGWVYYDKDEYELSESNFKTWFDINIDNFPIATPFYQTCYCFYLGLLDLKRKRIDSVKSRLVEMKSVLPAIDTADKDRIAVRYDLLSAEVLLAENFVEKAIVFGKKVTPLGMTRSMFTWYVLTYNVPFFNDTLARAYHKKGNIDKAIAEYERLIMFDPGSKERRLIHPTYHYRLATCYEEKGSKAKAIERYEKFLDIWKDADADRPEKIDAKKRLAVLKASS